MRNGIEMIRVANLIRGVARGLAPLLFAGNSLVEGCLRLERGGMPASYRLSATARDYALLPNHEQLAAILAARVGDARISPTPPLWPLLALLLLGWRDSMSTGRVMDEAVVFQTEEHVQRGLEIVAYLFPELKPWLAGAQSRIPLWERALAVPLAARKLVMLEKLD